MSNLALWSNPDFQVGLLCGLALAWVLGMFYRAWAQPRERAESRPGNKLGRYVQMENGKWLPLPPLPTYSGPNDIHKERKSR